MRRACEHGYAIVLVLSIAAGACAENQLDVCGWNATDIVLVTEGTQIDGVVEVLESWKGDCKPAGALAIPALAAFAPANSREISQSARGPLGQSPFLTHVTGLRMVLFLRRSDTPAADGPTPPSPWQPASHWRDIKVSVAWIEGGQAYAFYQCSNPGPTELLPLYLTEAQMRERIMEVVRGRSEFDEAMAGARPQDRAKALFEMATSRHRPFEQLRGELQWTVLGVQAKAIEALGGCGEAGLPWLQRLWREGRFSGLYGTVVNAVRQSAGAQAGQVCADLLSEEVPFWRTTVASLSQRSPDQPADAKGERVRELRVRAQRLVYLLEALTYAPGPDCRDRVEEIRSLLQAMPPPTEGGVYTATCLKHCARILDKRGCPKRS
ncbi:MAG: hypothetical protein IMZ55_16870 [Acidobacteria bacterium]|nr:hypothetical protein [Acidobacteriota bacterium]